MTVLVFGYILRNFTSKAFFRNYDAKNFASNSSVFSARISKESLFCLDRFLSYFLMSFFSFPDLIASWARWGTTALKKWNKIMFSFSTIFSWRTWLPFLFSIYVQFYFICVFCGNSSIIDDVVIIIISLPWELSRRFRVLFSLLGEYRNRTKSLWMFRW